MEVCREGQCAECHIVICARILQPQLNAINNPHGLAESMNSFFSCKMIKITSNFYKGSGILGNLFRVQGTITYDTRYPLIPT
jgi:hypothetical protein